MIRVNARRELISRLTFRLSPRTDTIFYRVTNIKCSTAAALLLLLLLLRPLLLMLQGMRGAF